MTATSEPSIDEQLLAEVSALAPGIRERAAATEAARELPGDSVNEFLELGLPTVLVPRRWGGMELPLETWLNVVVALAKADASHAWCAGLLMHGPQMIAAFPEEAQRAVWGDGPNVPIAGSIMPVCSVKVVEGGYRVSGRSPFASGIGHATWAWVAGFDTTGGGHVWRLFLVAPGEYTVVDTWHTAGMAGTGSNTIVTEDVFIPESHSLALGDLVDGTGPGVELHSNPIYALPFVAYAPVGFVATMLGAALGAHASFLAWARERRTPAGVAMSGIASVQARSASAAADLDAAELLIRRVLTVAQKPAQPSLELRARSLRDCARASQYIVGAIDELMVLSGTSGFTTTNPLQRAWRDIHFASCHISINPELAYTLWGGMQLGADRPQTTALY
jgi:3-hydroxy-9,10-secoandrosta-1,3,5(10)-triene-9,17-dione monooxygenase